MIQLRNTTEIDLTHIVALEQQSDIREFIAQDSLEKHQAKMKRDNTVYLSIEHDGDFAGYMILIHHPETDSIECGRIVISSRGKGIGQQALKLMEDYCKATFGIQRIWLDVFDFNARGIHIYTKLGYQQFDTGEYDGKTLLYLEKFV